MHIAHHQVPGTGMTHLLFTKPHEVDPVTFLLTDEKVRHGRVSCHILGTSDR